MSLSPVIEGNFGVSILVVLQVKSRICWIRLKEPAAEAIKAEVASRAPLLITRPSDFTGRDA